MGHADLHIHTVYSDGLCTVPAVLEAARRAGLDLVAITDHEEVRGALEAQDLASKYGVEVVPGEEIDTADGHLVALFIEESVPAHLSLRETVLRVAGLGGLCVAAHPESRWVNSLRARTIAAALADERVAATFVGVEVHNAGVIQLSSNALARAIADRHGLAHVASTDSHLGWTIGRASTRFPGRTPADLRRALTARQTEAVSRDRHVDFFAGWLKGMLLRRAGWAYWTPEPGEDLVLRRLSEVG